MKTLAVFFLLPALAGTPEEDWKAWVDRNSARLRESPTSFLNVEDALYVKKGQAVQVVGKPVAFDGKEARRDGVDLLKSTPWKSPEGRVITARILGDGDLRVIVHNPDHPKQKTFTTLPYFPYISAAVVKARLERAEPYREVKLPTVRNRLAPAWVLGKLRFEFEGKPCAVTAYVTDPPSTAKEIFVMFKDASNGKETYSGGRYLDVELDRPVAEVTELTLDFNRSYNPNCARSNFYNCIRVPGRPLPLALRAGELRP
jgi:hypothetical protein